MKFNNRPNKSIKNDGTTHWISRSCAVVSYVSAKIGSDFYILVGQRGQGTPDCKGLWNLPCGYLDWNESGREAFFREMWEETGINCEKLLKNYKIFINTEEPWYIDTNPDSHLQNISLHYSIVFDATNSILPEFSTENSEPDEVENLMWIKIKDAHKLHFGFDHKKRVKVFNEKFIIPLENSLKIS